MIKPIIHQFAFDNKITNDIQVINKEIGYIPNNAFLIKLYLLEVV